MKSLERSSCETFLAPNHHQGYHNEYLNSGLRSPIFSSCPSVYTVRHSSSVFFAALLFIVEYAVSNVKAATTPAAANDKLPPNPVGYFGDSFCKKMKDPISVSLIFETSFHSPGKPPQFPRAIMNAIPVALFAGPARLLIVHALL